MPTRARERSPWLLLGVLTVLLVVLGLLQYRWTSALGRAAAERRQAELQRTARRFSLAVSRELGRAGFAFFADAGPPILDRRAFLLDRLDAWQDRETSGMVAGLLLATRARDGHALLEEARPGDEAFHAVAWPAGLVPLREHLASESAGGPPLKPGALTADPLGIVLPLFGSAQRPGPAAPRHLGVEGFVIVLLDESYVRDKLLPRLAETQLGPPATRPFTLAVLRRADRTVLYASEPDAIASGSRTGDLELELPSRGRGPVSEGTAEAEPSPGADPAPPPPGEDTPWLLVARHRGGAFEAAVASVERGNLATGLFVLALLGVTSLMLVASAQRARRLARQQVDFVTGVTHELNTPLAAIRSAGQNLAAGIVTEAGQVRRYGDLIEKEGRRLSGLVAQVLDYAGIESGSRAYAREPLSLATLVDEVLSENRLVLEQSGIVLECSVPDDLPELRGDAPALRRALANLVSNAAKFAAAGRWLGVRAFARPDGRVLVLRVEDRGPGIPQPERERVFEPFYRGPAAERNHAPGSGLGLSLVRHVVRAHGGEVHVEGREGGGAALVVELPTPAGSAA